MNINKILGYILLIAGILLIVVPLYQTYQIFTGKVLPVQVFSVQGGKQPTDTKSPNNPFDLQQQLQKSLMNILPIDLINNTLNLASWMILMWILIYGGSKLAGIGIQLL